MCFLTPESSIFVSSSYNLFVNNFGDIWWFLERKKFCFSHWERFLIFYVHFLLFFPFYVAPFYCPRRSKLKIYCVSVPFWGLLKAFSSFIWKKFSFFASCCLIFWNINDDYTERKVFHAWFSSALRLPSHILTHSINV